MTANPHQRRSIVIDGVDIDLPMAAPPTNARHLGWQRRVLADVLPDSPVADAAEKILFGILRGMTGGESTDVTLEDVLSGELAPLDPLFRIRTSGGATVPAAFHVLPVSARDGRVSSKTFSIRTFTLLTTDASGRLDETLLHDFVERFRADPESLDLAQRCLLTKLKPGWTPDSEPKFEAPSPPRLAPFLPDAAKIFRDDLRTLVRADLSVADFFQQTNLLLAMHFGLYQGRLAASLNPALATLFDEFAKPGTTTPDVLAAIEAGSAPDSGFKGSLVFRAPPMGHDRAMPRRDPCRLSFIQFERGLAQLHFSLMMLHRLREVVKSFLRASGIGDEDYLDSRVQRPSNILQVMEEHDRVRPFVLQAFSALCEHFQHTQLDDADQDRVGRLERQGPTSLHTMQALYQLYDQKTQGATSSTRAEKHGMGATRGLLARGEYGLIQRRRGRGAWFEIGVGMLPLLLMLIVGVDKEAAPLTSLWEGLRRYGIELDQHERELLLLRLKSMGLFERYSDAGEASYVRSLVTGARESING